MYGSGVMIGMEFMLHILKLIRPARFAGSLGYCAEVRGALTTISAFDPPTGEVATQTTWAARTETSASVVSGDINFGSWHNILDFV